MPERRYWVDLFTWTTWQEFLAAGGETSGFRMGRWRTVQQIKPGDYLLCYVVRLSRWIGILEVVSDAFMDDSPIWKDDAYPCRVKVKQVAALTPETALPLRGLPGELTIFKTGTDPRAVGVYVRGSPTRLPPGDGEAIANAILAAVSNPVSRPVVQAKLTYRPKLLRTKQLGAVTIPESQQEQPAEEAPEESPTLPLPEEPAAVLTREASLHTEIQWLLLKLGCDMGLDVWVARNDRGRSFNGNHFADLPRLKQSLPIQFDEATNRTIELIDVLWLRGNAIVAAFEIESTTSIYSGLLRMSDLLSMQPNLNIPLYLVAPDERREKVVTEINRPTFSRLTPPMHQVCKLIPFSVLRQRVEQLGPMLRYLKPEFLDELSESCKLDALS